MQDIFLDDNYGKQIKEIRQVRKREIVIQMLTVYGDESSDEKRDRVFTVVGIIGTEENWERFAINWNNRTGGMPYHATDCLAGYGNYREWPENKRIRLHHDLCWILAESDGFIASSHSIDVASFNQVYPGADKDEPFYLCFQHIIVELVTLTKVFNQKKDDQHKQNVKFIFHERQDKYNVGILYDRMEKLDQWNEYTTYMEPSIEFAFSEKYVGLQAADLWAFEVRKDFDNLLRSITNKSEELTMLLSKGNRFLLHHYFRSNLIDQSKRVEEMENSSEYWLCYQEWLSRHRRNNNRRSRIEFIGYWDDKQKGRIK